MSRKRRWLLGWIVLGTIAGTVGAIAYTLHQATRLPSWYAQSAASSAPPALAAQGVPAAREQVATQAAPTVLTEDAVEQWLAGAIAQAGVLPALEPSVRQIQASVDQGELRAGTLVNLDTLPTAQLEDRERAVVERAIALLPPMTNREVFVGIEMQPVVENGQLVLGNNATLQIGELRLPLEVAAQRLGISVQDLERYLNQAIENQGLTPADVRVEGDRILLGTP